MNEGQQPQDPNKVRNRRKGGRNRGALQCHLTRIVNFWGPFDVSFLYVLVDHVDYSYNKAYRWISPSNGTRQFPFFKNPFEKTDEIKNADI